MLVVHEALSMYILHEDGWKEEELGACSLMRLHEGAERLRLRHHTRGRAWRDCGSGYNVKTGSKHPDDLKAWRNKGLGIEEKGRQK